jgi:hypothetical protein
MNDIHTAQQDDCGIQELTADEISCVSGGLGARSALAAAGAIGTATFGATWGGVAVGAAFAAAPIAVVAMGGLTLYAAYKIMSH